MKVQNLEFPWFSVKQWTLDVRLEKHSLGKTTLQASVNSVTASGIGAAADAGTIIVHVPVKRP